MSSRFYSAILVFLLILWGGKASAQYNYVKQISYVNGYIITNSGDSINGYISKPGKNVRLSALSFKNSLSEKKRSVNPIEIKRFGFNSGRTVYVSADIPMQNERTPGFVKLIMDGPYKVMLYEFLKAEHVLISDPGNKVYDLTFPPDYDLPVTLPLGETRTAHILAQAFAGNNDLLGGIRSLRPEKREVIKYLSNYYRISNIEYKVTGVPIIAARAGIFAGINLDRLTVKPSNAGSVTSAVISPTAGINLSLHEMNSGFGLFAENSVSLNKFHFSYSYPGSDSSTELRETFLNTLSDNTKIGFSWNPVMKGKIAPVFDAGGSFTVFLNPKAENYEETVLLNSDIVFSNYNTQQFTSTSYIGGFARAGLIFRTGKNLVSAKGGISYLKSKTGEKLVSVSAGLMYQFSIK
jgi:hypothetical protein